MEADWGIELGPSAPALEIPWHDPEGRWSYVELRGEPGKAASDAERQLMRNVDRIPEAHRFPALRQFLLQANAPHSPWQTAKCGVWAEKNEEPKDPDAVYAQHSYVDLVLAGEAASQRESLQTHERLAREWAALLDSNERLHASAEIVVRRCYFHRAMFHYTKQPEESDAGYCLTLFLTGHGATEDAARECWEQAIGFAIECLQRLQTVEKSV